MEQKRPSIPMQVQAFRRRRWRPRWSWVLAAALVALVLIWRVSRTPGDSSPQPPAPASIMQPSGPPWQMGNPEGRFTLTLYADLECPFCREYFPQLKHWVGNNTDVALQWHHQPLAAHEPARVGRGPPGRVRRRSRRACCVLASRRMGLCPYAQRRPRIARRASVPRIHASHQAVHGKRTSRRRHSRPGLRSHQERRDRHAVAAAARSPDGPGHPAAGAYRGRCLAVGHGHAGGWGHGQRRGGFARHPHIRNACRRCRRHAQVVLGLEGYGAARRADRYPFAFASWPRTITAAR